MKHIIKAVATRTSKNTNEEFSQFDRKIPLNKAYWNRFQNDWTINETFTFYRIYIWKQDFFLHLEIIRSEWRLEHSAGDLSNMVLQWVEVRRLGLGTK